MKTFSSTTTILFLAVALPSSVSVKADNNNNNNIQCDNYLKSHTSAHPDATNYEFTRQGIVFGGPPRTTRCRGQKTTEYTKVYTAENCANMCASDDKRGMRDGLTLLGYNYNCHTQKCDCLRGNEWDDIESTVHDVSSHWACYTSDHAGPMPTPSPTPAKCELPNTATGSAGGTTYTFTREEPQGMNTSCDIGESFIPDQNIDSVEQCADKCARKSQMLPSGGMGSTIMKGFDYNCDSKECTCLTAPSGTNLREAVQFTKRNMACYSFGGEAQMATQKYLRAA